ncbi:response regulator transcription factor [Albimonas pacifica]|uniref:Two-component system, OmpR family, response regulator n=1 Tax=Albimonas pacifica TaxID=1114924 RepID=A0A1I3NJ57_9RHOB|nr:response regulator transcription factor [Albimonas pacifica]SFJ09000.1 two-component system, OmpR family, response regulator [Albimonas pacifica]
MTIPRLLVVDDDPEMRGMLTDFLRRNGLAAVEAATGAQAREAFARHRIDLILLDVMLGDESGLEICARLRAEHDVPIVMLSALSADHQRMAGYEQGADDYVAKPFNPDLLLARIRAVLRRTRRAASLAYRRAEGVHRFAGWTYDARTGTATGPDGVEASLSRREAALLACLLANPNIPLTREEIAEALHDPDADPAPADADGASRAVDVLVGRLRSKIEENPRAPALIRTQRGVGYVLTAEVETAPRAAAAPAP